MLYFIVLNIATLARNAVCLHNIADILGNFGIAVFSPSNHSTKYSSVSHLVTKSNK